MLSVEDLHVHYGGSHVLQGVSFDVPATGVTALLGRNGVGKTTTLKAIIGLAPRTGRILLQGKEIQTSRRHGSVAAGSATSPRTGRSSVA